MKRRVAYFLLCLCFCFSTLSLSSSAVEYDPYTGFEFDFDTDMYYDPYTGQEMIYDEAEGSWYSLYKPLEFEPISTYRVTSPNFPDFDINKLPWLEMPSYVQEIINAKPIGLTNDTSYSGEYKLPFVSIVVAGSYIAINVGYNLCVGAYYQDATQKENLEAYRYYLIANKSHAKLYSNAVCYYAVYNRSDYKIRDAWTAVEPVAVGDNFVRYYNYNYTDTVKDSYFYGSSGMYAGRVLEAMKITSTDTDSFPQYVTVNNPSSGFASGTIMFAPDSWGGYISSFTPPSAEHLEASTSKGIWESIKELPSKIADSIKGFFTSLGDRISGFFDNLSNSIKGFFTSLGDRIKVFFDNLAEKIKSFFLPSEGYFDTYVSDFQNYFKDRFGFLYEVPDLFLSFFDLFQIPDSFVTKSDYSIEFPEVVLPYLDDNGDWHEVVLIEETEIKFDFLEVGTFATLYDLYVDLLWFIYIFALLGMIYRKAERFFGGTTE